MQRVTQISTTTTKYQIAFDVFTMDQDFDVMSHSQPATLAVGRGLGELPSAHLLQILLQTLAPVCQEILTANHHELSTLSHKKSSLREIFYLLAIAILKFQD